MYDIHIPKHPQGPIIPHTIVTLPNSNGMQLLLCYDNEGVYVNTYGKVSFKLFLYEPLACSSSWLAHERNLEGERKRNPCDALTIYFEQIRA